MAAGDKRKRVTTVDTKLSHADDDAQVGPNDADVAVRYSKLVDIRETQPERLLQEFMRESNDELVELKAQCEAQSNTIALLTEKLRLASEKPPAEDDAGGESPRTSNSACTGKDGAEASDEAAHEEAEPSPVVAPSARDRVGDPTPEDTIRMLRIMSGVVPCGTRKDSDGNICHEFRVSNPSGERFVRFSLSLLNEESSDPDGVISYDPLEVCLPGTDSDFDFEDGLDLDAQHASALLREILIHVLERKTSQAMASAKKSSRKSRIGQN
jgi:hypothetical protein